MGDQRRTYRSASQSLASGGVALWTSSISPGNEWSGHSGVCTASHSHIVTHTLTLSPTHHVGTADGQALYLIDGGLEIMRQWEPRLSLSGVVYEMDNIGISYVSLSSFHMSSAVRRNQRSLFPSIQKSFQDFKRRAGYNTISSWKGVGLFCSAFFAFLRCCNLSPDIWWGYVYKSG